MSADIRFTKECTKKWTLCKSIERIDENEKIYNFKNFSTVNY